MPPPPFPSLHSVLVSVLTALSTHLALFLLLHFLSSLPLLPLSALALVPALALGKICRRIVGAPASAPTVVVLHLAFVWGVYVAVVQSVISAVQNALFHLECVLLIVGFYRILSSDPGFVACGPSASGCEDIELSTLQSDADYDNNNASLVKRVRRCGSCKAYVRGFDHHCPAFGNCIGQKNHRLFMVLLIGFGIAEASFAIFSSQYIKKSHNMKKPLLEDTLSWNIVNSTMIFCLLQVVWQVIFLTWHLYCICFNIKTDEWANWRNYPEFQLPMDQQSGQHTVSPDTRFHNPYHKGIFSNIIEFLNSR